MKVMFINNDGGGFADYIDIVEGTTISQLFAERISHGRATDYLIRVSVTPTKIEGACL